MNTHVMVRLITIAAATTVLPISIEAASIPVPIVEAPDTPVHLESARILNAGENPLVLLYAAVNKTSTPIEQFMVTVFIYDASGQQKAYQTAPGRRTLEPNASKYSAMVLDGFPIGADDRLVVAVQQVQWASSGEWWSSNLAEAANARAKAR